MPARSNDFQRIIAMLVALLKDAEVQESKMFTDPDTGEEREVDVSYVVRGKYGGRDLVVGVECVDRSRKMDATWVEQMYGKHSRLPTNMVVLVSASGFYETAKKKAERFGYRTIHPAITKSKLAVEMARGLEHMCASLHVRLTNADITWDSTLGVTTPEYQVEAPGDDGEVWYRRADGSRLVVAGTYGQDVVRGEALADFARYLDSPHRHAQLTDVVESPTHEGESLYVLLVPTDPQKDEALVRVERMNLTASVESSETASLNLTDQGEYDGISFATGLSTNTVGDGPARFVVANMPNGDQRFMTEVRVTPPYLRNPRAVTPPKRKPRKRKKR